MYRHQKLFPEILPAALFKQLYFPVFLLLDKNTDARFTVYLGNSGKGTGDCPQRQFHQPVLLIKPPISGIERIHHYQSQTNIPDNMEENHPATVVPTGKPLPFFIYSPASCSRNPFRFFKHLYRTSISSSFRSFTSARIIFL